MKKTIRFLILAAWINTGVAQNLSPAVVSSAGESFQNNSIHIDWTLGEMAITTIKNSTNQITQGFHQPQYIVTSIDELPFEIGKIEVFPNPTSDRIEINLTFEQVRNIQINLIDFYGKQVWTKNNQGVNISEDTSLKHLSNGIYFLNILIDENEYSQTLKIQKLD